MRKKILLVGLMLLSTVGFAAKSDDDITNIIGNYYSNGSMSLETKETANNTSSAKSDVREKIIDFAKTKLGSPYVWGATGPNSFDCSGFVGYVYQKAAGLVLPRVSRDQAEFRPRISSMNMKKGDLVFFETTGKGVISHVGIYMGDRQFIHASSGSNMRVTISSLDTNYYSKAFRWAVNPFN